MGDTILSGARAADAATTVETSGVTIDRELYGADHPVPKEMFSPEVALRPTLSSRVDDVANVMGLDHAKRQARHRDFVALVRETGLDPNTVGAELYDAYTDAQLAEARGTELDEAQIHTWKEDARRELRQAYGADAEPLLKAADQFIQKHPRLQRVLDTRAIGARPEILRAIVDHVRRQRFAPKKK